MGINIEESSTGKTARSLAGTTGSLGGVLMTPRTAPSPSGLCNCPQIRADASGPCAVVRASQPSKYFTASASNPPTRYPSNPAGDPICTRRVRGAHVSPMNCRLAADDHSTTVGIPAQLDRSEEHTSELQSP